MSEAALLKRKKERKKSTKFASASFIPHSKRSCLDRTMKDPGTGPSSNNLSSSDKRHQTAFSSSQSKVICQTPGPGFCYVIWLSRGRGAGGRIVSFLSRYSASLEPSGKFDMVKHGAVCLRLHHLPPRAPSSSRDSSVGLL